MFMDSQANGAGQQALQGDAADGSLAWGIGAGMGSFIPGGTQANLLQDLQALLAGITVHPPHGTRRTGARPASAAYNDSMRGDEEEDGSNPTSSSSIEDVGARAGGSSSSGSDSSMPSEDTTTDTDTGSGSDEEEDSDMDSREEEEEEEDGEEDGSSDSQDSDSDDAGRAGGNKHGGKAARTAPARQGTKPSSHNKVDAAGMATPGQPRALRVVCAGMKGVLQLPLLKVLCTCSKCAADDVAVKEDGVRGVLMSPTEFEKHCGRESSKKWRNSIRVDDPDEDVTVGTWLDANGYTAPGARGRKSQGDDADEECDRPRAPKSKKVKRSEIMSDRERAHARSFFTKRAAGGSSVADGSGQTGGKRSVRQGQTNGSDQMDEQGGDMDGSVGAWTTARQSRSAEGEDEGEVDKQATLERVPRALPVSCNGYSGTLDCLSLNVTCACPVCRAGPLSASIMAVQAFERHAGREQSKKWKESVRVDDGTNRSMKKWYQEEGRNMGVVLPSRGPERAGEPHALKQPKMKMGGDSKARLEVAPADQWGFDELVRALGVLANHNTAASLSAVDRLCSLLASADGNAHKVLPDKDSAAGAAAAPGVLLRTSVAAGAPCVMHPWRLGPLALYPGSRFVPLGTAAPAAAGPALLKTAGTGGLDASTGATAVKPPMVPKPKVPKALAGPVTDEQQVRDLMDDMLELLERNPLSATPKVYSPMGFRIALGRMHISAVNRRKALMASPDAFLQPALAAAHMAGAGAPQLPPGSGSLGTGTGPGLGGGVLAPKVPAGKRGPEPMKLQVPKQGAEGEAAQKPPKAPALNGNAAPEPGRSAPALTDPLPAEAMVGAGSGTGTTAGGGTGAGPGRPQPAAGAVAQPVSTTAARVVLTVEQPRVPASMNLVDTWIMMRRMALLQQAIAAATGTIPGAVQPPTCQSPPFGLGAADGGVAMLAPGTGQGMNGGLEDLGADLDQRSTESCDPGHAAAAAAPPSDPGTRTNLSQMMQIGRGRGPPLAQPAMCMPLDSSDSLQQVQDQLQIHDSRGSPLSPAMDAPGAALMLAPPTPTLPRSAASSALLPPSPCRAMLPPPPRTSNPGSTAGLQPATSHGPRLMAALRLGLGTAPATLQLPTLGREPITSQSLPSTPQQQQNQASVIPEQTAPAAGQCLLSSGSLDRTKDMSVDCAATGELALPPSPVSTVRAQSAKGGMERAGSGSALCVEVPPTPVGLAPAQKQASPTTPSGQTGHTGHTGLTGLTGQLPTLSAPVLGAQQGALQPGDPSGSQLPQLGQPGSPPQLGGTQAASVIRSTVEVVAREMAQLAAAGAGGHEVREASQEELDAAKGNPAWDAALLLKRLQAVGRGWLGVVASAWLQGELLLEGGAQLVALVRNTLSAHLNKHLTQGYSRSQDPAVLARRAKKAHVLREGQLSMIVYGFDERLLWAKRVGMFIRTMRAVLGDRSLHTNWGGSVIDSVVGVFLTQNVSDVLSSMAFMSLSSTFPSKAYRRGLARRAAATHASCAQLPRRCKNTNGCGSGGQCSSCSCCRDPDVIQVGTDIVDWDAVRQAAPEVVQNSIQCRGMQFMLTTRIQKFLNRLVEASPSKAPRASKAGVSKAGPASDKPKSRHDHHVEIEVIMEQPWMEEEVEGAGGKSAPSHAGVPKAVGAAAGKGFSSKTQAAASVPAAAVAVAALEQPQQEQEQITGMEGVEQPHVTCGNTAVTIGALPTPEAVQHAQQGQDANGPVDEGRNEESEEDDEEPPLSLEWMREATDAEALEFLLGVAGLGRKSAGCVMLMALGKKEYPVDTNVARVCARLGWVPLQSEAALEQLDQYPDEPEVHKYLHERMMSFDQETLYELHYLMITLGKVFCAKRQPNCSACPLASDCDYARCNGPRLGGPLAPPPPIRTTAPTPTPAPSPGGWRKGGGRAADFPLPAHLPGSSEGAGKQGGSSAKGSAAASSKSVHMAAAEAAMAAAAAALEEQEMAYEGRGEDAWRAERRARKAAKRAEMLTAGRELRSRIPRWSIRQPRTSVLAATARAYSISLAHMQLGQPPPATIATIPGAFDGGTRPCMLGVQDIQLPGKRLSSAGWAWLSENWMPKDGELIGFEDTNGSASEEFDGSSMSDHSRSTSDHPWSPEGRSGHAGAERGDEAAVDQPVLATVSQPALEGASLEAYLADALKLALMDTEGPKDAVAVELEGCGTETGGGRAGGTQGGFDVDDGGVKVPAASNCIQLPLLNTCPPVTSTEGSAAAVAVAPLSEPAQVLEARVAQVQEAQAPACHTRKEQLASAAAASWAALAGMLLHDEPAAVSREDGVHYDGSRRRKASRGMARARQEEQEGALQQEQQRQPVTPRQQGRRASKARAQVEEHEEAAGTLGQARLEDPPQMLHVQEQEQQAQQGEVEQQGPVTTNKASGSLDDGEHASAHSSPTTPITPDASGAGFGAAGPTSCTCAPASEVPVNTAPEETKVVPELAAVPVTLAGDTTPAPMLTRLQMATPSTPAAAASAKLPKKVNQTVETQVPDTAPPAVSGKPSSVSGAQAAIASQAARAAAVVSPRRSRRTLEVTRLLHGLEQQSSKAPTLEPSAAAEHGSTVAAPDVANAGTAGVSEGMPRRGKRRTSAAEMEATKVSEVPASTPVRGPAALPDPATLPAAARVQGARAQARLQVQRNGSSKPAAVAGVVQSDNPAAADAPNAPVPESAPATMRSRQQAASKARSQVPAEHAVAKQEPEAGAGAAAGVSAEQPAGQSDAVHPPAMRRSAKKGLTQVSAAHVVDARNATQGGTAVKPLSTPATAVHKSASISKESGEVASISSPAPATAAVAVRASGRVRKATAKTAETAMPVIPKVPARATAVRKATVPKSNDSDIAVTAPKLPSAPAAASQLAAPTGPAGDAKEEVEEKQLGPASPLAVHISVPLVPVPMAGGEHTAPVHQLVHLTVPMVLPLGSKTYGTAAIHTVPAVPAVATVAAAVKVAGKGVGAEQGASSKAAQAPKASQARKAPAIKAGASTSTKLKAPLKRTAVPADQQKAGSTPTTKPGAELSKRTKSSAAGEATIGPHQNMLEGLTDARPASPTLLLHVGSSAMAAAHSSGFRGPGSTEMPADISALLDADSSGHGDLGHQDHPRLQGLDDPCSPALPLVDSMPHHQAQKLHSLMNTDEMWLEDSSMHPPSGTLEDILFVGHAGLGMTSAADLMMTDHDHWGAAELHLEMQLQPSQGRIDAGQVMADMSTGMVQEFGSLHQEQTPPTWSDLPLVHIVHDAHVTNPMGDSSQMPKTGRVQRQPADTHMEEAVQEEAAAAGHEFPQELYLHCAPAPVTTHVRAPTPVPSLVLTLASGRAPVERLDNLPELDASVPDLVMVPVAQQVLDLATSCDQAARNQPRTAVRTLEDAVPAPSVIREHGITDWQLGGCAAYDVGMPDAAETPPAPAALKQQQQQQARDSPSGPAQINAATQSKASEASRELPAKVEQQQGEKEKEEKETEEDKEEVEQSNSSASSSDSEEEEPDEVSPVHASGVVNNMVKAAASAEVGPVGDGDLAAAERAARAAAGEEAGPSPSERSPAEIDRILAVMSAANETAGNASATATAAAAAGPNSRATAALGGDAARTMMPLIVALNVLGWPDGTASPSSASIKSRYRELAPWVHPDKSSHPLAASAFGYLTQAMHAALRAGTESGTAGHQSQVDEEEEIYWIDPEDGTIRIPGYAKQFPAQQEAPPPGSSSGNDDVKVSGGSTSGPSQQSQAIVLSQLDTQAPLQRHTRYRSMFDALVLSPQQMAALPYIEDPEEWSNPGEPGQRQKLARWPKLADDGVPYLVLPVRPLGSPSEFFTAAGLGSQGSVAAAAASTGWVALSPDELQKMCDTPEAVKAAHRQARRAAALARARARAAREAAMQAQADAEVQAATASSALTGPTLRSPTGVREAAEDTFMADPVAGTPDAVLKDGLTADAAAVGSSPQTAGSMDVGVEEGSQAQAGTGGSTGSDTSVRSSGSKGGRGGGRIASRGAGGSSGSNKQMSIQEGLRLMQARQKSQPPAPPAAPAVASAAAPVAGAARDLATSQNAHVTVSDAGMAPGAGAGTSCWGEEEAAMADAGAGADIEGPYIHGVLLLPVRTMLCGAFPLNATYFQVNEIFVDVLTSLRPVRIPLSLLRQPSPPSEPTTTSAPTQLPPDSDSLMQASLIWRTVYFGLSTASIVRDMSLEQVAQTFNKGYIGVRSFDRITGAPRPLPPYLMPQGAVPSQYMQQQMEQDRQRELAKQQLGPRGARGRSVRFVVEEVEEEGAEEPIEIMDE